MSNTIVSDNGTGILVQAFNGTNTTPGVISKVTATNNNVGILVGYSHVMIANSVLSNNNTGLETELAGIVRLAQTAISGNVNGVSLFGGPVYSYGNNYINENTSHDVYNGTLTPGATQ